LKVERTGFAGGSEKAKKVENRGVNEEGEGVEGDKGKGKRGEKSGEAHDVTSKRSLDENWIGEDQHP